MPDSASRSSFPRQSCAAGRCCRWSFPTERFAVATGIVLFLLSGANAVGAVPVHFGRDIRPILADKCLHCHGPDDNTREAGLRLDDAKNVLRPRDGYRILVPGQPGKSELYRRISATDALQMPPSDQLRQLSEGEKALIRRWIEEGAEYEGHWAFLPPERPPLPAVKQTGWPRNAIDRFVLARLEREGLKPSPPADKPTLIRRVTLDLTGLPPTPAEVGAFLRDASPAAYENVVDRLLASPHYGEKMALTWLDAARFADSGGYQGDILRTMWPWRDWVIAAYNRNMPFDQFTIEQLAGDLLPNATSAQKIATGFNRNHRINDEDGIIFEEFRVEYVVDRVDTTATVWMGLTLRCAQCHDHKYDPFSQRDFYRFYAYFNSIAEQGRGHGNAPPVLKVISPELQRRLDAIDQRLAALPQSDHGSAEKNPADGRGALEQQKAQLIAAAPTTMVMQDLEEPRDTHVLIRGAYNRPGEQVTPGVLENLLPLPPNAPRNRLGLARWLLDPRHPLTARVAVNRYWQTYFGRGIVATPEDFGTQGERPTHPDLLDWLATEFIRTGWDVKALQRLIVTSATYRQSSAGSPSLFDRDPENRLLARGPRFRLPAELLRDQMLAAGGLLNPQIGGPSVRPYQPEGLWKELASASPNYEQSHGADLYRRSLYTFIRRTVPPPSMTALDAPNREICIVRRARTNTPIQALVLMNDPTFVEASRGLAARVLAEDGSEPATRIEAIFRYVLARRPKPRERQLLLDAFHFYHKRYQQDGAAARKYVSVGESPVPQSADVGELAAYAAVAGLIMNLDEAVTKE